MNPYLKDEEIVRLTYLQSLFPKEDFGCLLQISRPHLKSDFSFNEFLNRMMSQKKEEERTESDIEEENIKELLKDSFKPHINYDQPLTSKSLKSEKKIKQPNFLFEEVDDYVEDNSEELNRIIYGSKGNEKEMNDSDSDVEYHSCGEEKWEPKYPSDIVKDKEISLNGSASNNFSDRKKRSDQSILNDGKEQEKGISKNEKPIKDEEPSKNETRDGGNEFSFFNSLINSQKKKEAKKETEPESKQEPEKKEEARKVKEAAEDSRETETDVGQMIDHFFMQDDYAKKRSSSNDPAKEFEKTGAIPKRMGTGKGSTGQNKCLSPKPFSQIPNLKSSASLPEEKMEKKLSISNSSISLRGEDEVSLFAPGSEPRKKDVEREGFSSKEKLRIEKFPFIYAVPENPSSGYCLPKGNYYVLSNLGSDLLTTDVVIVRHPETKIETAEKPLKGFEKAIPDLAKNKSKEPASETKKEPSFPSFPPMAASNFQGDDTIKINRSEVKAKIFCNTPLQSLKKDGEDGNGSTDAYGAILQSVANDFGSADKSNKRKKRAEPEKEDFKFCSKFDSSSDKKKSTECFFTETDPHANRRFFKINNSESKISDKSWKFDYEKEPVADYGGNQIFPEIIKKLINEEPEQSVKKSESRREGQKYLVQKEPQESTRASIEQALLDETYSEVLLQLPELDPEFLYWKSKELNGDERAIDSFIQEEKVKLQLVKIKNRLSATFPLFNEEFLDLKAKDFLCDPDGLETFILEEKRRSKIDEQYELMVKELPGVDPVLLSQKSEEFDGNAIETRNFIEKKKTELLKEEEKNMQIINMHLILPDADPEFLQMKHEELSGDAEAFNLFLYELLDSKNYPKIKKDDPLVRERNDLWKRFVENFDVKDFLTKVPNPEETYSGTKGDNNKTDIGLILKFLQSRYPELTVTDMEKIFRDRRCNLTETCTQLDFQQKPIEVMDVSFRNENISESFLLELVFILRRREIRDYLLEEKALRQLKLEKARDEKSLLNCLCCFEDELLDTDVTTCPEGHIFCIDCIRRSVETKLSDGNTKFECLAENCDTEFSLATLEKILRPGLYGKVLRKKQSAEVNEAKVPGLESCPSCDFAYIPNQHDKIFKCQNQDCLRETCRECKEESHLPLRCEEIERAKDTKVRTEIEEKMTMALVRTCPKCGKKFVKTDGCNKMTCTCGAVMCYLCRKLVDDYNHFNGQGGDRFHLCPLFSTNEDLHVNRVREVGVRARDEALRQNPDVHLVHDPTKTI